MAQSVTIGIAFGDVIIYSVNCTPPPWPHRRHNTSPIPCPIMGRTRGKKHRLLPWLSVSMFLSHTAQPLVIGVRYMEKAAKKQKQRTNPTAADFCGAGTGKLSYQQTCSCSVLEQLSVGPQFVDFMDIKRLGLKSVTRRATPHG